MVNRCVSMILNFLCGICCFCCKDHQEIRQNYPLIHYDVENGYNLGDVHDLQDLRVI